MLYSIDHAKNVIPYFYKSNQLIPNFMNIFVPRSGSTILGVKLIIHGPFRYCVESRAIAFNKSSGKSLTSAGSLNIKERLFIATYNRK